MDFTLVSWIYLQWLRDRVGTVWKTIYKDAWICKFSGRHQVTQFLGLKCSSFFVFTYQMPDQNSFSISLLTYSSNPFSYLLSLFCSSFSISNSTLVSRIVIFIWPPHYSWVKSVKGDCQRELAKIFLIIEIIQPQTGPPIDCDSKEFFFGVP